MNNKNVGNRKEGVVFVIGFRYRRGEAHKTIDTTSSDEVTKKGEKRDVRYVSISILYII